MAGDATFAKDLEKVLNDMESASTILQRDSAARALYSLVGFVDVEREEVDPKLITRIVAQLNTDEDNVRIWVAMTLGSLGPRAKEAAPKLLEILPQVDCARASLNSAPAIRIALERMGVTPPARNCQGINGERSN